MASLRHALRSLRRQPGSAAVVVVTLSISIAATIVLVSLIEFLLHAIPVADPARLVFVSSTDPRPSQAQSGMRGALALSGTSVPDLVDWSARAQSIDEFIAYRYDSATWRERDTPERLRVVRTTVNLPAGFGLRPAAGRVFRADDGRPGAPPVVLLSEPFWRRRFGAQPAAVGASLLLDGTSHTVAGVLPAAASRGIFMDVDLFIATPLDASRSARDDRRLFVFGLLRPGATIDQASAELSSIAAELRRGHPGTNAQTGAVVRPLLEQLGGNITAIVGVMALIAALIVALACANVSNVMLATGTARRRELSIRSALGARRFEHMRQLMLEALVMAVAAGALGLALGSAGLALTRWLAGPESRLLAGAVVNGWVAGTGVVVAFLLPLAFGLVPAFTVSRADTADLKDGARLTPTGGRRLRTALVAIQVGLAVVLMVQIAIMGHAAVVRGRAPLGFDPSRTLTFTLQLPADRAGTASQLARFERDVVATIATLPGVEAAAVTSAVPVGDRERVVPLTLDGRPAATPAEMPTAAITAAGLGFFETLRVPVDEGRTFEARDGEGGPLSVVISREAARRFWPGQSALGRTLTIRADGWPDTPLRVIGIVRDVRAADADRRVGPQLYVPWSSHPERRMRFLVRTTADPMTFVSGIRRQVAAIEPNEPVFDLRAMDRVVYEDTASEFVLSIVMSVIALIALAMAAVGIYGLVAHDVTQRTREIGIRIALGAPPATVVRRVVHDGIRPVLYGGLAGFAAAAGLAVLTAASLMGDARDPLAYSLAIVTVALAALAATYAPARRAGRIDPIDALRAD